MHANLNLLVCVCINLTVCLPKECEINHLKYAICIAEIIFSTEKLVHGNQFYMRSNIVCVNRFSVVRTMALILLVTSEKFQVFASANEFLVITKFYEYSLKYSNSLAKSHRIAQPGYPFRHSFCAWNFTNTSLNKDKHNKTHIAQRIKRLQR